MTLSGTTVFGLTVLIGSVPLVYLVIRPGNYRFLNKRWEQQQSELTKESATFRARWSGNRLWSAPHAEVKAEAVRCWQIVDLLQQRNEQYKHADVDLNGQIAAMHRWLATLHQAMNVTAG